MGINEVIDKNSLAENTNSVSCHGEACCVIESNVSDKRRLVLMDVFWINAALFVAECSAGWLADSSALLGDSLDKLGDATAYGA